jgi:hypothetical protein
VGKLGPGELVDCDRHAVLQREAPVTREVVCVRVRLEHALDPDAVLCCSIEVLLDAKRRIDHQRDPSLVIADEIRGAAETVVDELPEEQHGS